MESQDRPSTFHKANIMLNLSKSLTYLGVAFLLCVAVLGAPETAVGQDKKPDEATKEETNQATTDVAAASQEEKKSDDEEGWRDLFNGKDLDGWKVPKFGGAGEVEVVDGEIRMAMGSQITGVTFDGEFPKSNYEISYEAKLVEGNDFFGGVTFPVGDSHASFIPGGWGGSITGFSSINGHDAAENETTTFQAFKKDTWYTFVVRVTDNHVDCLIDGKRVVNLDTEGKRISTRGEVNLSKPFGFSAWQTKAALKNIRMRDLKE
jgi:Domain of Unknown Function (DUF1080)